VVAIAIAPRTSLAPKDWVYASRDQEVPAKRTGTARRAAVLAGCASSAVPVCLMILVVRIASVVTVWHVAAVAVDGSSGPRATVPSTVPPDVVCMVLA